MYIYGADGVWRYYNLAEPEPILHIVQIDLDTIYSNMGFNRPDGFYGFWTAKSIAAYKEEQTQMKKADAVM